MDYTGITKDHLSKHSDTGSESQINWQTLSSDPTLEMALEKMSGHRLTVNFDGEKDFAGQFEAIMSILS